MLVPFFSNYPANHAKAAAKVLIRGSSISQPFSLLSQKIFKQVYSCTCLSNSKKIRLCISMISTNNNNYLEFVNPLFALSFPHGKSKQLSLMLDLLLLASPNDLQVIYEKAIIFLYDGILYNFKKAANLAIRICSYGDCAYSKLAYHGIDQQIKNSILKYDDCHAKIFSKFIITALNSCENEVENIISTFSTCDFLTILESVQFKSKEYIIKTLLNLLDHSIPDAYFEILNPDLTCLICDLIESDENEAASQIAHAIIDKGYQYIEIFPEYHDSFVSLVELHLGQLHNEEGEM